MEEKNNLAPTKLPSTGAVNPNIGSTANVDRALQSSGTGAVQQQQQGLAGMFAATGQQIQAGKPVGQQGLAGTLGNYRGMWQPGAGSNYQVIGGASNII